MGGLFCIHNISKTATNELFKGPMNGGKRVADELNSRGEFKSM